MTPPGEVTSTAEAGVWARQATTAYREMVASYKHAYQLAHAEAVARADAAFLPTHARAQEQRLAGRTA